MKDPTVRWTSLLFAIGQNNIAVTGKGTIDGRGWEVAIVDGSQIEDIVFERIQAYNTGNPIFLRLLHRNTEANQHPCLRHVYIRNSAFEVPLGKPDAGYSYEGPVEDQPRNISPASIVGCPDQHISGIVLENVDFVFPPSRPCRRHHNLRPGIRRAIASHKRFL